MKLGRPNKVKIIRQKPEVSEFSPRGRAGRPGYIELGHEEFEALRLYDHTGLKQRESARFMGISQQTFSRVLKRGRKKVSGAIVKGLIIRIKGGDYKIEI